MDRLVISQAKPPQVCEDLVVKMKVPRQVLVGGTDSSHAKVKALVGNKGSQAITNLTLGLGLPQGLVGTKAAMRPRRASVPAKVRNASIFWLHLPLLRPLERWKFKVEYVIVMPKKCGTGSWLVPVTL